MRVSEVLDYFAEPYLVAWKLKTKGWEKVSQDALIIGSVVDQLVQDDLNGKNTAKDDYAHQFMKDHDAPITMSMKAWGKFKMERPDVVKRLFDYRHNMQRELVLGDLVGHPDFILDDEVIDLKTSKSVSKSHWMQTAQYAHMVPMEVVDVSDWAYKRVNPITKISILRLDKLTGDYEYKTLEEPFISFWQRKFQARYEAFCEDKEFATMMQVKLEEEKL